MSLSDFGAIGSIVSGVTGLVGIFITLMINKRVKTIDENAELANRKDNLRLERPQIYTGKDAERKYEEIRRLLPDEYPYIWGPNKMDAPPSGDVERLEVFDVDYQNNANKMGFEWKNCIKGIRYDYKDGMHWFSRGWRI